MQNFYGHIQHAHDAYRRAYLNDGVKCIVYPDSVYETVFVFFCQLIKCFKRFILGGIGLDDPDTGNVFVQKCIQI